MSERVSVDASGITYNPRPNLLYEEPLDVGVNKYRLELILRDLEQSVKDEQAKPKFVDSLQWLGLATAFGIPVVTATINDYGPVKGEHLAGFLLAIAIILFGVFIRQILVWRHAPTMAQRSTPRQIVVSLIEEMKKTKATLDNPAIDKASDVSDN